MESVVYVVFNEDCGVWSLKCEVWRVECGFHGVARRVWSVEILGLI